MNKLKFLREVEGLSLQDLSNILEERFNLKIGRASLNNYERGSQTPKQEVWDALARVFNVKVTYLMGLSSKRNDDENQTADQSVSILVESVVREVAMCTIDKEVQRKLKHENVAVPPKVRDIWLEKITQDYSNRAASVDYKTLRNDVGSMVSALSDFSIYSEEEVILSVEAYNEAILDITESIPESKKDDRWQEIRKISLEIKETIDNIRLLS